MKELFPADEQAMLESICIPAVSIILPFEPKMFLKSETSQKLKLALEQVQRGLMDNYPSEKAAPVLNKLKRLVRDLNYNTHKKSIAIFVSPLVEKVYYLDIPVEEKVVIGESFEIRDLVCNKKQTVQYLILILSGKSSKMYWADHSKLVLIKSNTPNHIEAFERDMPEKTTHFSDPHHHHEILLSKFVRHMDEGLTLVLRAYPLPVFVLGVEKVLGNFKKMTHNKKNIVGFVHGNFEDASMPEILLTMQPHVAEWKKVKQQSLLQELEDAASKHQLDRGIKEARETAGRQNGKLLIVEKNYTYPAGTFANPDPVSLKDAFDRNPFYIKDAVDDIIEKVLKSGGDVEFVDDGLLEKYNHIALVRYY